MEITVLIQLHRPLTARLLLFACRGFLCGMIIIAVVYMTYFRVHSVLEKSLKMLDF